MTKLKLGDMVEFDFAGMIGVRGKITEAPYILLGLKDEFITAQSGDTEYPIRVKECKKIKP